MDHKSSMNLSNDAVIVIFAVALAGGAVMANVKAIGATIMAWLTRQKVLAPDGAAVVGLDLPRIVVLVGAGVVMVAALALWHGRRRRQQLAERRSQPGQY